MRIEIIRATAPDDIEAVKTLFIEYLNFVEDFLGESLAFQGTETEFATFPNIYDSIFLAKCDGQPAGACGLKPFKNETCELKRLYVRPDSRGHGIGQTLSERAIHAAREQGYSRMFLDTDHGLHHANAVYEALGFKDVERYYDNPMDSRFMALNL